MDLATRAAQYAWLVQRSHELARWFCVTIWRDGTYAVTIADNPTELYALFAMQLAAERGTGRARSRPSYVALYDAASPDWPAPISEVTS